MNIGGAEITIGIYEGEHIKLDNHLPTQRHIAVTVSRADLVKAAKKAHALVKAKGMGTTGSALAQWNAEKSLTLAPFYGQEEQAKVRGAKVTASITHGTTDHVQGHTLTLNARFLLDALDTFTGDTVTLHLQAAETASSSRPSCSPTATRSPVTDTGTCSNRPG
ncbi:hypothetical protein [Actinacidiphila soli]|uniref:hypothetical protein n=1 Tax=Actinacidiphila soli TaxID=2487275 RepID=UPI001F0BA084|nr:hypothetical protein [Actinacidiphila soli]